MSQKLKRLTTKEIESGKGPVPRLLDFERDVKYLAAFQRNIRGKPKWYVEVRRTTLKSLVEANSKLEETLSAKKSLEDELNALKKHAALLEHNNVQIVRNRKSKKSVQEDSPSPENSFTLAEKMNFEATSSKPYQGGSPE